MSDKHPQLQNVAAETVDAVRETCREKLDRALSPTTTIRARDVQRMGVDADLFRIALALERLEKQETIAERGFSMTVEPNGDRQPQRYRLAETEGNDD